MKKVSKRARIATSAILMASIAVCLTASCVWGYRGDPVRFRFFQTISVIATLYHVGTIVVWMLSDCLEDIRKGVEKLDDIAERQGSDALKVEKTEDTKD